MKKMTTPNVKLSLLPVLVSAMLCSTGAVADSLADALAGGKVDADIRFRYETVEQNNALQDATALSVRTRLGYTTGDYHGIGAAIQFENITADADEYNSTLNGNAGFSTVADPEGTEVNQAYLTYKDIPDTTVKYGRQRIIYDNARFVGNVGWRQNEQTFSAFSLENKSLPDTTIKYAYVTDVRTITFGSVDSESHLLNLTYSGLGFGTITVYDYMIEYVTIPVSPNSNQTLGIRFAGSTDVGGDVKAHYALEFANQSDYADGSTLIDADYSLIEVGATFSGVTAKVGMETLGADKYSGFETPYATKHAFNGWADQFLGTPTNGLEDTYVSVGGTAAGVKLLVVYHDFAADEGGADYGSEIDFLASKKFGDRYNAAIKMANFSSDNVGYVDTDKLWLLGGITF